MPIFSTQTDDLDAALKVLANPVRRKILGALKQPEQNFPGQDHPYEWGVCAHRIEAVCGLAQSSISAHLAALNQAGLLSAKKSGQWVFYKRDEPAIAAFLSHLSQTL